MNLTELLKDQRHMFPKEDVHDYDRIAKRLPKFVEGRGTSYHCGSMSVQCFRLLKKVCEPCNVLEIGFNLGHSTCMLFEIAEAYNVLSVDVSTSEDLIKAINIVKGLYGDAWDIILGNSMDEDVRQNIMSRHKQLPFDVVFIDGDHSIPGVDADVEFALRLNPKYIFFDDLHEHWGPGTIPAIKKHSLKIVAAQGNMCICEPPGNYRWS